MADFTEAIQQFVAGTMLDTLGLRLLEVTDDHAVAQIAFRPELAQLTGLFHTGTLLALADSAATFLCMYAIDPSGRLDAARFPLAIQLSSNLIRNAGSGIATAEARWLHSGRTTMVAHTTIRDSRQRILATVTTTHLTLAGQPPEKGGS